MFLCVAVVHSFSLLYSNLLYDYTTVNPSTFNRYLGCFHLLALLKHAGMIIVCMSPYVVYRMSLEKKWNCFIAGFAYLSLCCLLTFISLHSHQQWLRILSTPPSRQNVLAMHSLLRVFGHVGVFSPEHFSFLATRWSLRTLLLGSLPWPFKSWFCAPHTPIAPYMCPS